MERAKLRRTGAAPSPIFPAPNNDGLWPDGSGLYSKGIAQQTYGNPDPTALKAFLKEIDCGKKATSVPITPDLFEPATAFLGGTGKLNGPQAAFAAQPKSFTTGLPPTVGDLDYAVELVELYWASLLRDLPFTAFKGNSIVDAAVNDLNGHLGNYRGPVDPTTRKITPDLLFRGGLPANKRRLPNGQPDPAAYFQDEMSGPYVSQLCLWPTSFGAQQIDQKMQTYAPGQDFMTDLQSWYDVQRGKTPVRTITADPMRRFMHNGRALAAFTRQDELYQAYFIAYLVLKTWQVPQNPGLPYIRYKISRHSEPLADLTSRRHWEPSQRPPSTQFGTRNGQYTCDIGPRLVVDLSICGKRARNLCRWLRQTSTTSPAF